MGVGSTCREWKRQAKEKNREGFILCPLLQRMCSTLRELILHLSVVVIETALRQLL